MAFEKITTNDKVFNYECSKCKSTYINLSTPLTYSNCKAYKGRNPNPIFCNGLLIESFLK